MKHGSHGDITGTDIWLRSQVLYKLRPEKDNHNESSLKIEIKTRK